MSSFVKMPRILALMALSCNVEALWLEHTLFMAFRCITSYLPYYDFDPPFEEKCVIDPTCPLLPSLFLHYASDFVQGQASEKQQDYLRN